eukprot:364861-Chlamydomonas_euryale.AAC.16
MPSCALDAVDTRPRVNVPHLLKVVIQNGAPALPRCWVSEWHLRACARRWLAPPSVGPLKSWIGYDPVPCVAPALSFRTAR